MNEHKKEILLFGAGKLGKAALSTYGHLSVYGFVDNDAEKCNKLHFGKPVLTFKQLCENKKDYDVVIASKDFCAVYRQCIESGVIPADIFLYSALYTMDDLIKTFFCSSKNNVGLYGRSLYAKAILRSYQAQISSAAESHVILLDRDDNGCVGTIWHGIKVHSLEEICDQLDTIIISAPRYNRALDLKLHRELASKNVQIVNPFKLRGHCPQENIVANRYASTTPIKTETEFNANTKLMVDVYVRDVINAFVDEANVSVPLFSFVELETQNRCNGSCTFCPVNKVADPRPYHKMKKTLFEKIVTQLAALEYKGRISLYSNNEPFLDERLIEFSALLRDKLPFAYIYLFTNGTMLTVEKFTAIYPLLDEMIIDNYSQDLQLLPPVKIIYDFCEVNPIFKEKVTIQLRLVDEIMTTRGGNSPNRENYVSYGDVKCARPFQQLVIRPTGEISLCCNDAIGKYTMGDLNKESILDVWHGKKFAQLREAISKGRSHFGNCQHCDIFTLG